MASSFTKECERCGEAIRITDSFEGWLIYNIDTGTKHLCGQDASTSRQYHDGPLTVRTHCWFCDSVVYFHRAERGGLVLFDSLGKPWPVHPCWKKNTKYQDSYIENLYQSLKSQNLSKSGEYDFISDGIHIKKPSLSIIAKSNDHKALDTSVGLMVEIIRQYNFFNFIIIPLSKSNSEEGKLVIHTRLIKLEQQFSATGSKKMTNMISDFTNLDLPKTIDLSIVN